MRLPRKRGATSVMVRIFIPDNSATSGAGLTGLTSASTNLVIAYARELDASFTTYTGANIEAQTTIGTFQAPSSSSKIRFKAVDATNFPGLYEIQFHDSATAFGSGDTSQSIIINILETSTTALKIGPNAVTIPLVPYDPQDGVRMGLTALPNAAAGATNGLPLAADSSGRVDVLKVNGTSQTARDLGGQLDAAISTRMATFTLPTNFSSLAIDSTGRVNAFLIGILTSVFTEGATGRIAAAFKQFFNIAAPAATMDHGILVDTVTTLTTTPSDSSGVTTLLSRLSATRAGYLDNLSAGAAALEASVQTVLSKLLKYVQLLLRKDSAIATDNATEVTAINANGGSGAGAFDNTTDAQEALRDRGDAAWTAVAASAIRSAVGLGSANLDTQLGAIAGYIDTEVAAIKAKTDNLPSSPAAVGDIPTANQNADALLDRADAIETGLTLRQSQRLVAAAAAGNVNGSGGTVKNVGNSKTRINFSGDGTNRTVSSTDVT